MPIASFVVQRALDVSDRITVAANSPMRITVQMLKDYQACSVLSIKHVIYNKSRSRGRIIFVI